MTISMKPKNEVNTPGLTPRRRQLLETITKDEAAAGARAYRGHARGCRAAGIVPAPFSTWLAEWLECRRADQGRPLPGDPLDEGRHEARDYWRPFEALGEK
jgi:hypothetical protein